MHNHNHEHAHNHQHEHSIPEKINSVFVLGILLNSIYVVVEAVYGISVNSMALVADAGHNLSDVLGLGLAWGAGYLSLKQATRSRTYGYRKSTILAALLNAILLLIAIGAIGVESIKRFAHPAPVQGGVMITVALIGVIINTFTALLFIKGKEKDLNIKGAFLHMAADAAVSLGVVAAGIIISYTGWQWVDPAISIVIMLVILLSTWNLLKDSFNLAMDSVPPNIETDAVEAYLKTIPEVVDFHDLHIWAMSTTQIAMTVHIIKDDMCINDDLTEKICRELHQKFGIEHTTIQFEAGKTYLNCKKNYV